MNREFATKLGERVASMFALAFLATYAAGSVGVAFHTATPLSVAQRSLIAGIAAVAQLLIGTLIGPFVGNPNSPSILPRYVLKKLGTPVPTQTQLIVTVDDVIQATLAQMAKQNPQALAVKVEDVAKEVLAAKATPVEKPQPPQPASSDDIP